MSQNELSQILNKCSQFKPRDFKNNKNIEYLHYLEEILEHFYDTKRPVYCSLELLKNIITNILLYINQDGLWTGKKKDHSINIATIACRFISYICELDVESARNLKSQIQIILQWLQDDQHYLLKKFSTSTNQNLSSDRFSLIIKFYQSVYDAFEHYYLICSNRTEFVHELLSKQSKLTKKVTSYLVFSRRIDSSNLNCTNVLEFTVELFEYLLNIEYKTNNINHLLNRLIIFFSTNFSSSPFSDYLIRTNFYKLLLTSISHSSLYTQFVINETAQSQTDSTDSLFIYSHMLNIISEFVLNPNLSKIIIQDLCDHSFIDTMKMLIKELIDCGTTTPLLFCVQCLSNILSTTEASIIVEYFIRSELLTLLTNYLMNLIEKSTLGNGKMIIKYLHVDVIRSILSIMYNISTLDDNYRVHFNVDIISQLFKYLVKCDYGQLRIISCLLFSNIATQKQLENESELLSQYIIEQLLVFIRNASKNDDHHLYDHTISLLSLVQCLKKICVYDIIKLKIEELRGIELLFKIIRVNDVHHSTDNVHYIQEELEIILECIWFLAFNDKCATKIYSNDIYFSSLVQIAELNPNEHIVSKARGTLWQLTQTLEFNEQKQPLAKQKKIIQPSQHIMISYNHDTKDVCMKICNQLRKNGYTVWIDTENMHGSTLECMALAIEQAFVILLCITEKYKQSPNCQCEAEYAYRLKKPFVPILMQKKYKPDGWLGILVGTRLYIDFNKNDFQTNYEKLLNEIEAVTR